MSRLPASASQAPDSFARQYAATRRFTLGAPRTFTVSPDGTRVLFLRSRDGSDEQLCLWATDLTAPDANDRIVVDPRELSASDAELPPEERARRERARESAGGIVSYSTDRDANTAAFSLAGHLFVADVASGKVAAVDTGPAVFDPRLDPSGSRVAYVSGRRLRVVDLEGNDRLVCGDDDPLVSWGRAEFIAGEEMGRSRGYWWSPDGSRLLVARVAEHDIERWWIADPANPDREPTEIRYPSAGSPNATVGLVLVDLDGAETPFPWDGDGRYEYLADVVWAKGHEPLIVRQPRDQRSLSIASLDVDTGEIADRLVVDDETWVDLMPGSPAWFGDGLLTIEDVATLDRRALCLDGEPITGPEINVKSILGVSGDRVTVTAWTDPTEIHVFDIDIERGVTTALTSVPGVHSAAVGGSTTVVLSTVAGEPGLSVRIAESGHEIANYADTPVLEQSATYLELGSADLRAALFVPAGHDGRDRLPVLLDPYGGPHAQRVLKASNAHLVSQWFANQGFAVLVVDGRGTPGRGPSFERAVWGDLAEPVLEDQIDALDAAGERFPFLDLDRVGIRGWSFGGYLAALAVMRRPDRVHAAVAGAPVTTWRLYDTHYTERYLGRPEDHPEHYDRTDLLLEAGSLDRPLLLIHGLADDNVVAAHTLRLSSALLAAGRPHQVLPLSGVTHMTPQEVVAENLLHLQRDFLRTNLIG